MHGVIHRLLRPVGLEVAQRFRRARGFWEAFHKAQRSADSVALGAALTQAQHRYEALMEFDRHSAKETTAWTCLATLYDERCGWSTGSLNPRSRWRSWPVHDRRQPFMVSIGHQPLRTPRRPTI